MVDTPKYKSNFVRGLEENNNRILTYVTIFFTFAFLGCLLAFWIYEHRGSRCVFGPSCCYTQMSNTGSGYSPAEVVLQQRDSETNWGPFKDATTSPEIIQLDASTLSGNGDKYTFYAHLYPGQNTTGGPSYPNITESNSGFCIGTSGVSLYFDYYTSGSGVSWDHAYNLFYYAVNQYTLEADFLGKYFGELLPPSNKIIKYVTNSSSENDGHHLVTTNKDKNSSFFSNLTPANNSEKEFTSFISLKKNNQDGKGYNPYMDFKKTRQIVDNTGTGTGKLYTPICIEPSSKNLPSCRLPRTSQGYPIIGSNGNITYSQNCSHNSFPGQKSTGSMPTIEQLIPKDTYVGERLSACGGTNGSSGTDSGCGDSNCSSTGCTGGESSGSVDLKVGNTKFSDNPGSSSYANAYLSANIFCGKGTRASPEPMYETSFTGTNNVTIRDRVQGSTIPNATKKNGVFTLGFK